MRKSSSSKMGRGSSLSWYRRTTKPPSSIFGPGRPNNLHLPPFRLQKRISPPPSTYTCGFGCRTNRADSLLGQNKNIKCPTLIRRETRGGPTNNDQQLERVIVHRKQRGGTPNGDSKSARHSQNSRRQNGREFPLLEAQMSLSVRRRSNGGKRRNSQQEFLNRGSSRSPWITRREVYCLQGARPATFQTVRNEPLRIRNPLETTHWSAARNKERPSSRL